MVEAGGDGAAQETTALGSKASPAPWGSVPVTTVLNVSERSFLVSDKGAAGRLPGLWVGIDTGGLTRKPRAHGARGRHTAEARGTCD